MKSNEVMEQVVTRLIEKMEAGAGDWSMPWRKTADLGLPVNATTGKAYRGGNILSLWMASIDGGFTSTRWATFKQWHALGASVRKGAKGTHCIYYSTRPEQTITVKDEKTGDDVTLTDGGGRGFWKSFVVFNASQVDGDPAPEVAEPLTELERIEAAERFFGSIPAVVNWGGGRAFYSPEADAVTMPAFDAFNTTPDAYATLAHELTHWTGHTSRLGRTFGKRFGDEAYGAEDLVAELGAAITCARIGIETVERTDHAGYLASWVRMLKATPSILWTVASQAQKASDFLAEFSPALVSA